MNTIIAYLETMFSAYPQTPKLLEAKAELRTMMEDAYQGFIAAGMSENEAIGGVISEFGNIDEIAPTLGISAEIQSNIETPAASTPSPEMQSGTAQFADTPANSQATQTNTFPQVSLDEAMAYSEARQQSNGRLAAGIALFICSPVAVIFLLAWHNAVPDAITSGTALAIGLVAQFVCIALGVVVMIDVARTLSPHRRLRELRFSPDHSVTAWADARAEAFESRRVRGLQIAVLCWVFAPLPLLLLSLLAEPSTRGAWSLVGVAIVLIMAASGVAILVTASWARSVARLLSGSGPLANQRIDAEEDGNGIVGVIASLYWPIVVIVYLLWSFAGNAWGISWIVFPIAGLLFGAIAAGTNSISAYRKSRVQ
ncbi:permease prefix domain 1-containing protein [Leucobacter sp. 1207-22]|uniref:permease prefix domain 1-containing protein n=1 Tax=Leucobacter sp. 1207-22 TaxID=2604456 RepID=UPI0040648B31